MSMGVAGFVMAAVLGQADVTPLFGFEKDAVARFAKFEVDTSAAFAIHNSFAGRSGDATEGRWALARVVANAYGFLGPGNRASYYNRHRIGCFLNTAGWFAKAMPADWSNHDAFRVDLKSDTVDLKVSLELEDDAMADPVVRQYAVPAGKWVALEVDLAEVAKRLGLDLKRMAALRLIATEMARPVKRTTVLVDNLRLVPAGAPDPLPVLRDLTPLTRPVRAPGPVTPLPPVDLVFGAPPAGKVAVIDLARDPKWRKPDYPLFTARERCLGAFGASGVVLVHPAGAASVSVDAGATWQGLDGKPGPTRFIADLRGHRATVLVDGRDLYVAGIPQHCAGGGGRTEMNFTRALYCDGRWSSGPQVVFEGGIRHCADRLSLVKLKGGRLWLAWDHLGQTDAYGIHAKYSDNGGVTWKAGGRNGLVGEEGGGIPTGPYLAEWQGGVACVWRQRETLYWSRTDGERWTPAERVRGREAPLSVVSAGGSLFVAVTREDAVLRYDGKTWVEDSPPTRTGLLARAGDEVVCVSKRKTEAGTEIVLCRRPAGGRWGQPQVVAVEPEPVEGLAVPQVAGTAFLPVAWTSTSRRWIKLAAVPLRP